MLSVCLLSKGYACSWLDVGKRNLLASPLFMCLPNGLLAACLTIGYNFCLFTLTISLNSLLLLLLLLCYSNNLWRILCYYMGPSNIYWVFILKFCWREITIKDHFCRIYFIFSYFNWFFKKFTEIVFKLKAVRSHSY